MDKTYCGMVAIVGRPNVGKSTILNQILGQKISITSRKPQTTRHRIMGIDTVEHKQAIYVDTPGLHSEEKRAINRLMNRAASSSLAEVGLVLFVVEGTRWNDDDALVLNKIKESGIPAWLVVNKTDKVEDKTPSDFLRQASLYEGVSLRQSVRPCRVCLNRRSSRFRAIGTKSASGHR